MILATIENKAAQVPKVREASFEDYPQIASLERRHGFEPKSYAEWRHLWINNPVYNALQHHWPIGWVLEYNGQIMGYFGNIPLSYEFDGRKIITATGRSWIVDSHCRSYSIWLLHHFLSQRQVDLYLSTTANYDSAQVFSAFDTFRVPVGTWDRSALWITDYRRFIASWLTRKVSPMAKPLTYPLTLVLYLRDRMSESSLTRERTKIEIGFCANFDDRFDVFWEELRRENSHLLLAVRTKAVLEWHFKPALLENRVWILTVCDASGLVAYSIFLRRDNARSGISGMRLVDFQALGENADLLLPMFSRALKKCQQEGIHTLENIGLCFGKSNINDFAPYQRKRSSWSYFYTTRDKSLAETLSSPEVWAPSLLDGDASL